MVRGKSSLPMQTIQIMQMMLILLLPTLLLLVVGSFVSVAQPAKAQARSGLAELAAGAPIQGAFQRAIPQGNSPTSTPDCSVAWRIMNSPNPSPWTNYL